MKHRVNKNGQFAVAEVSSSSSILCHVVVAHLAKPATLAAPLSKNLKKSDKKCSKILALKISPIIGDEGSLHIGKKYELQKSVVVYVPPWINSVNKGAKYPG